MKKLSIIIPVYNEAKTIGEVIRVIHNLQLISGIEKEVIVVNDCSKDDSKAEISRMILSINSPSIKLCEHAVNKGKGGAIHTGIKEASGDYTVIQDADLELDPSEINLLLKVVLDGKADIVYGSRFLNKEIKGGSWMSNRANAFLTWLSNRTFGIRITDMETCYKLVPTSVFKSLKLVEQRFGFEPEITAKLAKHKNLKWAEVPITYNARTNEEGKKIGWKDGFRAVWCILKYGLGR
ncbi:MAG: glycosyltransferase family 2 protein [Crocinitomicaceae bacterium]|nr:glycosyltransferase family 2 protein [Crocinitomicaceae bacterium]MBK6953775.1 glycosyltransferase family 2 protein [Crocinitomicaceae bacterium]